MNEFFKNRAVRFFGFMLLVVLVGIPLCVAAVVGFMYLFVKSNPGVEFETLTWAQLGIGWQVLIVVALLASMFLINWLGKKFVGPDPVLAPGDPDYVDPNYVNPADEGPPASSTKANP